MKGKTILNDVFRLQYFCQKMLILLLQKERKSCRYTRASLDTFKDAVSDKYKSNSCALHDECQNAVNLRMSFKRSKL